jgi:glycine cleavage system H protein
VAGAVIAVNDALADAPQTVNEQPFGSGWLFKLQPDDPAQLTAQLGTLLSAADYGKLA